jgi:hypothetical protein
MFNCFAKIRFYPFQTLAIFGLIVITAITTFAYFNKKYRPNGALRLLILLWLPNCRHYVAKTNVKR